MKIKSRFYACSVEHDGKNFQRHSGGIWYEETDSCLVEVWSVRLRNTLENAYQLAKPVLDINGVTK